MAIICNLNRNLLKTTSCGYMLNEIVDLYLINYDDIPASGFTVTEGTGTSEGCDEITAIDLGSNKAYQVTPAKNTGSFEDTLVVNDSDGSKYRNASISFTVNGAYNACMHGSLDSLALGRYCVIVKTASGDYIAFGRLSPLEATTATLAGSSDSNGIQVVLAGNIAESPLPLSADAIEDLLSFVPTT